MRFKLYFVIVEMTKEQGRSQEPAGPVLRSHARREELTRMQSLCCCWPGLA